MVVPPASELARRIPADLQCNSVLLSELGAELDEVLRGLGDWGQKAQAYARQ